MDIKILNINNVLTDFNNKKDPFATFLGKTKLIGPQRTLWVIKGFEKDQKSPNHC